jgi:hypothetical protein
MERLEGPYQHTLHLHLSLFVIRSTTRTPASLVHSALTSLR